MSVHPDLTRSAPPSQGAVLTDARWQAEILPLLPPTLDSQARSLGAFRRRRGLADPATLLRALLGYVLCCASLRHLGAWALLSGLADLSEPAWRKHLRAANPWLGWLLGELLAAPAPPPQPPGRGRVIVIDASTLVVSARGDRDRRLHLSFNLSALRLHQLKLTDTHTGEHLREHELAPGDIGLLDGGYGFRSNLAVAEAQQVQVVMRIHPSTFPLEDAAGQPVDVVAWLRSERRHTAERALYCRWEQQRYAVRVLAKRLSAQAAARAAKRKRRKAQKAGRSASPTTLYLGGWVLLVTTLPAEEWPCEAVLRLYRARWQIELLFKQLKQQVHLSEVRVQRAAAVEAVLRLQLIAWALEQAQAGHLAELLAAATGPGRGAVSSWGVNNVLVGHLRGVVEGSWSATRLGECVEGLVRYLCGSPRRRHQQRQRVVQWLKRRRDALDRQGQAGQREAAAA